LPRQRAGRVVGLLTVAAAVAATQVASSFSGSAGAVDCSAGGLTAAVADAANSSTPVTLAIAAGCTYTLTAPANATDGGTGLAVINGNVTINGNGATITRSSASAFRFFDVANGAGLTLNNLTLDNGLTGDNKNGGGAVFNHGTMVVNGGAFTRNLAPTPDPASGTSGGAINNSGTLTVNGATFTGNSAMEGGGLFNQNIATINNSTFANNTATKYGGGALVNAFGTTTVTGTTFVGNTGPGGGAIDNDTTLVVSNSTFVNNAAGPTSGGAILNYGTATLTSSTLSGNTSQYAGNSIQNYGTTAQAGPPAVAAVTATLTIKQSIIANPGGTTNCANNGVNGSVINDGGYNIETGNSCGLGGSSQINTDPQLQDLASNGGPTQTMAITTGSPALDVIPSGLCATSTDQRGVSRPQGSGCDVGAYESRPVDQYVSATYPILLGRGVDPGGLASWASYLTSGGTAGGFTNGLTMSVEGRNYLISSFYQAYLNRAADSGGLNNWRSWMAGGHTALDVQVALLTSGEYAANFGSTNKAYVDSLYSNPLILNRTADAGGEATWLGALNAGVSRASVATAILTSAEAVADRVSAAYQLVLNRGADSGGLASWSQAYPAMGYDSGALNAVLATSGEYRARFQY
jgi:hypothetical protein